MPASVAAAQVHQQAHPRLQRVDTLDLKDKLTKVLGSQSVGYWQALRDFCSARLSRAEFEEHASKVLRSEHGTWTFDWMHPALSS